MYRLKIAVTILALLMILSAFILLWTPQNYQPTYIITAEQLAQKPDSYLQLENPDSYVLQAISNSQGVTLHSLDVTGIDELFDQQMAQNETSNFQINGSYYQIAIICVDAFPPLFLSYMFLASLVILPVSIVALVIMSLFVFAKRKKI